MITWLLVPLAAVGACAGFVFLAVQIRRTLTDWDRQGH